MVHSILDFSLFRSSGLKGLQPYAKKTGPHGRSPEKAIVVCPCLGANTASACLDVGDNRPWKVKEFKEHFSVETTSRVLKGVVENSFYFLVG